VTTGSRDEAIRRQKAHGRGELIVVAASASAAIATPDGRPLDPEVSLT